MTAKPMAMRANHYSATFLLACHVGDLVHGLAFEKLLPPVGIVKPFPLGPMS